MIYSYIRPVILIISLALSVAFYGFVHYYYPENLQIIRLVQFYGLTSLTFLYVTLLPSPLYIAFNHLPGRILWIRARQSLGLSAFLFGCLHAYFAFFKSLGGFEGLPFLSKNYILPILSSLTALIILSILALTSMRIFVIILKSNWKRIHRTVYIAGILIVTHALMLGSHFSDLSQTIPFIFLTALVILFLLELYRIDCYITSKFPVIRKYFIFGVGTLLLVGFYFLSARPYLEGTKSVSIHGLHKTASTNTSHLNNSGSTPIDKFRVVTSDSGNNLPRTDVDIPFQILENGTDRPISLFKIMYEKVMHTIIVDSTLSYYEHTHPEQEGNTFHLKTQFPKDGTYYIYLNYDPFGFTEQTDGFTISVGNVTEVAPSIQKPDTNLTKLFGNYEVTLSTSDTLQSAQLSLGRQSISLTVKDKATKKPITDLQPYLGAFGHLIMLRQSNRDYTHVHPSIGGKMAMAQLEEQGGPTIEFTPMPLQGKILEKGVYRIFAQFKHKDVVNLAEFTIEVK